MDPVVLEVIREFGFPTLVGLWFMFYVQRRLDIIIKRVNDMSITMETVIKMLIKKEDD